MIPLGIFCQTKSRNRCLFVSGNSHWVFVIVLFNFMVYLFIHHSYCDISRKLRKKSTELLCLCYRQYVTLWVTKSLTLSETIRCTQHMKLCFIFKWQSDISLKCSIQTVQLGNMFSISHNLKLHSSHVFLKTKWGSLFRGQGISSSSSPTGVKISGQVIPWFLWFPVFLSSVCRFLLANLLYILFPYLSQN